MDTVVKITLEDNGITDMRFVRNALERKKKETSTLMERCNYYCKYHSECIDMTLMNLTEKY